MPRRPGFLDEADAGQAGIGAVPPAEAAGLPPTPPPPLAGPTLLDVPGAPGSDRIEPDWAPEVLRPAPVRAGSLAWLAAGVALLLLGWLGLDAAASPRGQPEPA